MIIPIYQMKYMVNGLTILACMAIKDQVSIWFQTVIG